MRYVVVILLLVLFGYSMALVLLNGSESSVDLVFTQIPAMRLGLLLLITVGLGIIVGLLLGLQVFHVIQNKMEITRLKKEIQALKQTQMQEVASKALQYARESEYQKQHEHDVAVSEYKHVSVNKTTETGNKSPS